MIAGLCESPLTFQAIIIWRDELNESKILLREIIDLEATYAGPEAKQAPVVERTEEQDKAKPADDEDAPAARGRRHHQCRRRRRGSRRTRRTRTRPACRWRPWRRSCGPQVMETLDVIADTYKKLRKLQDQQVENRLAAAGTLSPSQDRRLQGAQGPADQGGEVAVAQPERASRRWSSSSTTSTSAWCRTKAGCCGWPKAMACAARSSCKEYQGSELDPNWMKSISNLAGRGWKEFTKNEKDTIRDLRGEIQSLATETAHLDRRVPQDRQSGAEGRARGGDRQEGDGRGQSAPGDLDRQEIHQPRPAVPRPDPGRQYRPDEGGRQVRVPARLQVLDLCDMVDPAGDHPLDRRPGAHHPHPGAHDRDDQQDRPHLAADAARDRPRADAGRAGRKARHAAREGAQGAEDRQGADLARDAGRRRGGFAISATSSRTRTRSCRSMRRSRPICAKPRRGCSPR